MKYGDVRGVGSAIKHTGCKVNNGEGSDKAALNRPTLFLAAICSLSVFRQYLTCVKYRHIMSEILSYVLDTGRERGGIYMMQIVT